MHRFTIVMLLTTLPLTWGQDRGILANVAGLLAPAERTPLTSKQRFRDYMMGAVGPVPVFSAAAGAGLSQAIDSPAEWGQGAGGYGTRLANNLAYSAVRNTLTFGVSAALHEDNRYFASENRAFGRRLLHALTSPAIAHKDGGMAAVSASSLFGIAGASALSRTWAPGSWQGMDNVGRSIGFTYAGMAGLNVAREFVPDILRHFQK
jgi:hypothetical protein